MKFLLSLCLIISSLSLFAQETASIEYSPDVDFNWGIFKGKVNPHHVASMGKNTAAVTVSSINYTTQVKGKTAIVKVTALFLPFESWTRYPKLEHPDEALNHEKRHFDICEIYARKIRQAIVMNHFSRTKFSSSLENIFNKITSEYRAEQNKYDRETKHSMDTEQQLKWNKSIDARLASLRAYSSSTVKVSLF
ncbi:MAG: DUF922 domain-containing protein [Saprospiraceae bacterium]|uniref:DUF922 domain-containing protein n=1 Tax=Candidatus Opimibacter skivensis TaxID=2982028 RepID=A0A9D7XTB4_9BACT|nr:DUF922 domain-containing protein [Candidatus Opimibacter skivensis]